METLGWADIIMNGRRDVVIFNKPIIERKKEGTTDMHLQM